ncbi:MAG: hypothetical protein M1818_007660 [Claussenomyces sp. TS43310]|nr:MAG: hypothetical protein M1818_007660 [Claussenomyces sp. TS43310]
MDSSQAWNGEDPALSSSQDDFQHYLSMGMNNLGDGLNFDFQEFNAQSDEQLMREAGEAMDTGLDGEMGLLAAQDTVIPEQGPPMTTPASCGMMAQSPLDLGHFSNDLLDLDSQIQYLQQQRHQAQRQLEQQQRQYFSQGRTVPPTPNSIEMQGSNQFYQQSDPQHQAMYEQYQMRMKEAEMAFTPLVSPAVTPLDTHFNISEYTVPGAYFTPLSSPALLAQHELRSVYDARMSALSTSTSPVDMELDANSGPTSVSNNARKPVKKAAKPKTSWSLRQSPIVKPQRRKRDSMSVRSPQGISDIVEPSAQQQTQANSQAPDPPRSIPSTEGSENESVSPEHLSEIVMAPPPLPLLPGSARNSPYLVSQNGQSRLRQLGHSGAMSPATPASLMRLAKSNQASSSIPNFNENDDHRMENFSLPEAANPPRPQPSRLDTQSDGQITPTLDTASVTPAFAPLPSPAFLPPPSLQSSPQVLPQNSTSASSSTSTPSVRKTPQIAVRGTKKRQSVSNVHISPALRPRISPSIKPLIRGSLSSPSSVTSMNNISDDTASLLLASKSNYQNILEGTHLPGVNYPTELSTNLTSKRTSHKIAEQGRRNRINFALQEIATLLPQLPAKDGVGTGSGSGEKEEEERKDGDGKGGGQSANSKASTVELAIDYIKQLKREVEEANKRAEEAERKLQGRLEKMQVANGGETPSGKDDG